MQPWSSKFASGFDIFFDSFSNSLIFFKERYFVVWDQFDRQFVSTSQPSGTALTAKLHQGKVPFTLNLANFYKQELAAAVNPEKTCFAL
jgi:hypothetical protein